MSITAAPATRTGAAASCSSPGAFLGVVVHALDGGLGGRHTGDRHAEGRAADVVQAGRVEEADRGRVAAVLAADPELEAGPRLAAVAGREPHELADALLVDRLKRRALEDPVVLVAG